MWIEGPLLAENCRIRETAFGQKRRFAITLIPTYLRHQVLTKDIDSIDSIAEQIGHTNGNIIRQHYGTWITEDGPDVLGMLQLGLKLSLVTAEHEFPHDCFQPASR